MTTRIVLLIPSMDLGGAEKQLCLLAENLPKDQFDVHVLLLTRDGPRSESLRQAGIPVTLIGKRFKTDPSALLRLRRELKRLKPQIVHTWLFAANSFGRAAAWMTGVPRILASERCVDPWKTEAHYWIDRRLAAITETITTNSSGVRDFYAAHGIDPGLFRIIPNGIEPRRTNCSIDRDEAFRRLDVPEGNKLILAVGRLWPQKRYRDLIWAAELLATLRQDITFVILGDGPQRGELLRYRDALTRPDRVRLAGNRTDVAELLPHADLFWIGSEFEGQSNSLIEAMQAGLAVVASDIPGNRDLVIPAETGRLVAVGDAAEFARQSNDLLEHDAERIRLGRAGSSRIAAEFTVEAMVQKHMDLYRPS
jgi:glycosyltransferase involved in cell wall biosynthesis